jgi:hypothetical protein
MDHLPSGPIQTSEALQRRQALQQKAVLELFETEAADFKILAEKLAKGNPKKAKMWRTRFRQWIHEPHFQQLIGMYSKGELMLALPGSAQALGRRASKGNVPAGKLLMEATDFHSPRSQVEHSGEIQITIKNAPRPVRTEDEVVDAEVVE